MALGDSKRAIGAVSDLLKVLLTAKTSAANVEVGRPQTAANTAGPKLNLFLYQVDFDPHLKNRPLDQGQATPLWLTLRYLLTAYDVNKDSDSTTAHELLGEGLLALQELNYVSPAATNLALAENPEPLKITFDAADTELLSKIMQGTDEPYRLSTAFQVRPVLLAPATPPAYAPAVQTVGPPAHQGVVVLPSLGPRLANLRPERFEVGQELTLTGQDLGAEIREVCIGPFCAPVRVQRGNVLSAIVPTDITLSPGSYPVYVRRPLVSGRSLSSNALLGHLLPTLQSATPIGLTTSGGLVSGTLQLSGIRLGGTDDSIFVAFYRNGRVAVMLEVDGAPTQTSLTALIPSASAIPAGRYQIILRVNGEQALSAPEVEWS